MKVMAKKNSNQIYPSQIYFIVETVIREFSLKRLSLSALGKEEQKKNSQCRNK